MSDAQVWTVIGVFAAALFSVVTLMSTMFVRVIRAEIGWLDFKIDSLDQRMNTKIDSLDQRMNTKIDSLDQRMDTKIDALESRMNLRFDTLDRDVQVLYRRAFGGDAQ